MGLSSHLVMLGPARCAGCGERSGWLCQACAERASPAPSPFQLSGITVAIAPWRYEGAARSLILALKLNAARAAAGPLIAAITASCRRAGVTADVVTWVPARREDATRRGFDHAEVLARGVAAGLGLPVARLLTRRGVQPDQTTLSRRQRLANLEGAFSATTPISSRVLLVDDLVTTGATAVACAGALRVAGAADVELAVASRA